MFFDFYSFIKKHRVDVKCIILFTITALLVNFAGFSFGMQYKAKAKITPNDVQTNPDWYLIENQPKSALKNMVKEKTEYSNITVEVFIGKHDAFVNGTEKYLDTPPEIKNSRTFLPLRFMFESIGYTVNWDPVAKQIDAYSPAGDIHITLWINKNKAVVETTSEISEKVLDAPPYINPKYGRTFVPFRFIGEASGGTVLWDGADKKATLMVTVKRVSEETITVINEDSDADDDGLTFSGEKKNGTNPNDPDTDKDGLSDDEEVKKYHTNPLSTDTDRDGLSDGEEIKNGLNPLQNFSNPFDISYLTDKTYSDIKKTVDKFYSDYSEKMGLSKEDAEKLKSNFYEFLLPKISADIDYENDYTLSPNKNVSEEVNNFFEFVKILPDDMQKFELNSFCFFEDGKLDSEEKAFLSSFMKNKEDTNNVTLAKELIDSYLSLIPSTDSDKNLFIKEIKKLPQYVNLEPVDTLSFVESYEDMIFLYLRGKPYKNFEDRFNKFNGKIHIDGDISDWETIGADPVLTDPEGDETNGNPEDDIVKVYATIQNDYLYVAFQMKEKADKDAGYIFPVDVNNDGDWDYSIGFDNSSVWFYDLRNYENGAWPNKSEVITGAFGFVGDIAEVMVPVEYLNFPDSLRIYPWVNAKVGSKLQTVDGASKFSQTVFNKKSKGILKRHDVWEGFDLMLRGGDYRQLEGEKDFEIMRKYANQIKFDGKGDDWENYPFLQNDLEKDLMVEPPKGVPDDSVDIIKFAFLRGEKYVYVMYKAKGKPSDDPHISWRFRVKLPGGYWCEIDEGINQIYMNRYKNNHNYGHHELTPKRNYIKKGDVVEYRIPLSKMWDFKDAKSIHYELWTRNLTLKRDIDNNGSNLGSVVNYRSFEYNPSLDLLSYYGSNTEFSDTDSLSEADAMSNTLYLVLGDSDVQSAARKDSLDLLNYIRSVDKWQKEIGLPELKNLPLIEKMFLTSRDSDNWIENPRDYSIDNFYVKPMPINVYRWQTVEIETLKEMHDFIVKEILPRSKKDALSIANNLDDYFWGSGFKKHWFYTVHYDRDKDKWIEFTKDINIDGELVNPHNFVNVDFIWHYFVKNGKGIGVCDDEASFVMEILHSIGISSAKFVIQNTHKFKDKIHYLGHAHVVFFAHNSWYSPKDQNGTDISIANPNTLISLWYYFMRPSFDIKNPLKLSEFLKSFEKYDNYFYGTGFPEDQMKLFIYEFVFPDLYFSNMGGSNKSKQ